MRGLSRQTFTDGRLEPVKRPGSARWRDVLFSALDNVVDCPDDCGWTYYRLQKSCPSCGTATEATALITVYPAADAQPLEARDSLVAAAGGETSLAPRHLWGRHDQPDPVVTFHPVRGGFEVEVHDEARLTDGAGKAVSKIPRPTGSEVYRVRLEAPGRPSPRPRHPVGAAGMKLSQIAHACGADPAAQVRRSCPDRGGQGCPPGPVAGRGDGAARVLYGGMRTPRRR